MPIQTRSKSTVAATRKQLQRRAAADTKPAAPSTATTKTAPQPKPKAAKATKAKAETPTKAKAETPTATATTTTTITTTTTTAPPTDLPVVLLPTLAAWEAYLAAPPPGAAAGVWLQIAKKASPTPSVTYAAAVDGALCHGWIDGQRRALSADHFVQRFTPRRRGSLWSARNVGRVEALAREGRMRPGGLAEVEAAKADGRWARAYAGSREIDVPSDLEAALAGEPAARAFLEGLGRGQRYSFLWRIETAKKAETRRKRIATCVEMLKEGKVF